MTTKRALAISRQHRLAMLFRAGARKFLRLPYRIWRWLVKPHGIFADVYTIVNNTHVTLYTDDAKILADYIPRSPLAEHADKRNARVSLIAPIKNEATNAREWCDSIARQTRPPDEIIVVDAGSVDSTLDIVHPFAASSAIPIRVIIEPECNIARARNLAIAQAKYPIIAATDFGCRPTHDWLAKLIAPFEANPETQVVAGLYTPVDHHHRVKWRGYSIFPDLRRINPADYLPSNRSIAFTRDAWQSVGGYPEWLTLTGEDTWFDRELQRYGGEWAFVPDVRVEWCAPENFLDYCRKVFKWAMGDGESGLHASFYWRYILQLSAVFGGTLALIALAILVVAIMITPVALWLALGTVIWLVGIFAASRITGVALLILFPEAILEIVQIAGFVVGARRRNPALKRRLASVRGTFFVLSGVPIDDTGGGARCTQIALELLRQNFAVVFIHKFPKYQKQQLDLKIGHPNLFHYSLAEFHWERFVQTQGQWIDAKPLAALVEFPLRDFLPLIENIRACNGIVVYDLLDAWDTALGGKWYAPEIEMQIAQASQVLVATVPALVDRLRAMTGRDATLLPNAVNTQLFDPTRRYARPADFPSAGWTLIYTGALWGDWFDWELLKQIGKTYPQAAIVVIGDYRGQCIDAPNNIYFLGLKAQKDLPAYLAHSNIAIIPWKANKITEATSPIKVYEYLAMRLPVVAPNVAPLRDMPGVYLAHDARSFSEQIEHARQKNFIASSVTQFITENTWQKRAADLIGTVDRAREESARNHRQSLDTFETALAEIVGHSIVPIKIVKPDFEQFKARYQDPRPIDDEKLLEYYISWNWLDFTPIDIFIDIAAQDCPFAFFVRQVYGCQVYRQDLYYLKPGIDGADIGGDAGNLPLAAGAVTKMALHNSFEHFERDGDIRFIREACRVLAPGGKICFVPLFIGDHYFEETDAGWVDEKGLKHLWGVGARFARHYDLAHFKKRILDNSREFDILVYRVDNSSEICAQGYLQYFTVFTKR